jgi:hypothetical protein
MTNETRPALTTGRRRLLLGSIPVAATLTSRTALGAACVNISHQYASANASQFTTTTSCAGISSAFWSSQCHFQNWPKGAITTYPCNSLINGASFGATTFGTCGLTQSLGTLAPSTKLIDALVTSALAKEVAGGCLNALNDPISFGYTLSQFMTAINKFIATNPTSTQQGNLATDLGNINAGSVAANYVRKEYQALAATNCGAKGTTGLPDPYVYNGAIS